VPKCEGKQNKQQEREDRAAGTEIRDCSNHEGVSVDCRNLGLGCWGDEGWCGGEGGRNCACCEEGTRERELRGLQWQSLKDMGYIIEGIHMCWAPPSCESSADDSLGGEGKFPYLGCHKFVIKKEFLLQVHYKSVKKSVSHDVHAWLAVMVLAVSEQEHCEPVSLYSLKGKKS